MSAFDDWVKAAYVFMEVSQRADMQKAFNAGMTKAAEICDSYKCPYYSDIVCMCGDEIHAAILKARDGE
jgi:hypothetical protein